MGSESSSSRNITERREWHNGREYTYSCTEQYTPRYEWTTTTSRHTCSKCKGAGSWSTMIRRSRTVTRNCSVCGGSGNIQEAVVVEQKVSCAIEKSQDGDSKHSCAIENKHRLPVYPFTPPDWDRLPVYQGIPVLPLEWLDYNKQGVLFEARRLAGGVATKECASCNGSGSISYSMPYNESKKETCSSCNGVGSWTHSERHRVQIG